MGRPRIWCATAIVGAVILSGCAVTKPAAEIPVGTALATASPAFPAATPTFTGPVTTSPPDPADVPPPGDSTPLSVPGESPDAHPPTATPGPAATPATAPKPKPPKPIPPQPKGPYNCAKQKCIALTFDDGPSRYTPRLLDILKQYNVHATFFVVGSQAEARPQTIARMVREGHVVGNHSYSHPEFWKLDAASIKSQITRTSAIIKKASGKQPILMRPPYGESNATVRSIEAQLGMAQVLWSIDPLDWKVKDEKTVATNVLKAAKPGAIVLSHDLYPTTIRAYLDIIPKLQAQGYVFVTVPQLVKSLKSGTSYSQR